MVAFSKIDELSCFEIRRQRTENLDAAMAIGYNGRPDISSSLELSKQIVQALFGRYSTECEIQLVVDDRDVWEIAETQLLESEFLEANGIELQDIPNRSKFVGSSVDLQLLIQASILGLWDSFLLNTADELLMSFSNDEFFDVFDSELKKFFPNE